MFKITEYGKSNGTNFSLGIRSGFFNDEKTGKNQISAHFFKWFVYIDIPELFIKPDKKWVDLSRHEWATPGRDGRKGYEAYIHKEYSFSFTEEALHVHYGKQTGEYHSDDKDASDRVKVWFYPWNLKFVSHDAYSADGEWLCSGDHFNEWKWKTIKTVRGNPTCKHEFVEESELNCGEACEATK
jgi:hypothetical protein